MPITTLNPNLLGTDSAGASKLSTAGGLVQLHSTGVVTIANTSANNILIANTGDVSISTNTVTFGTALYSVANGNMGIGTSSPTAKLEIGGTNPEIRLGPVGATSGAYMNYNTSGNYFALNAVTQGVSYRPLCFATDGGSVGIGTTSPLAGSKMEISGSTTYIPTATITADNAVTGWRVRRTGGSYPIEYYMGVRENSTGLDFYDNTANALRMRIDSAGRITKPYQPMFWAFRSGDGNVTSETDLSCNVADVNVGGHYNTSNFRFTAPVAGTYFFIVHAMNNQSNPGSSTVFFSKNGSKYHYFHIVNSHPSSSTSNVIMTLSAGDYVSCSATNIHYNGGSLYKYPVFGGHLIG